MVAINIQIKQLTAHQRCSILHDTMGEKIVDVAGILFMF
jgi:hypothetical protein